MASNAASHCINNFTSFSPSSLSFMFFATFNIKGTRRSAVNYWLLGRSGYLDPFITSLSGSHAASANSSPLAARTDSGIW